MLSSHLLDRLILGGLRFTVNIGFRTMIERSFSRRTFSLAAMVLSLALLFACSRTSAPIKGAPSNRAEHLLRLNMDSSPPSLDPRMATDRNTRTLIKSLFDGLMRLDADAKPQPAIASSVEISSDYKTYTFHLRPSLFSNGEKVTAYDFEHSWKSALDPNFPASYANLFYPIKNAKAAKEGRVATSDIGVTAQDEMTLIVTLDHPTPYFLNLVAHPIYCPVHKATDMSNPKWHHAAGKGFVCNGPFLLVDWAGDERILLKRNPSHWEGVALDGVAISFVKDPQTALLMFENGELDWMGTPFCDLPIDSIPALKEMGILHSFVVSGCYWLDCNTASYPLNSSKLRRALSCALDRKSLLQLIHQPEETLTYTIAPKHSTALAEDSLRANHERANAPILFQEALAELGTTAADLPPLHLMYSDISGQKALAQTIQDQWKEILGITASLELFEWNNFIANLRNHSYQLAGHFYDPAFDDPIYHLEKLKDPATNFTSWNDEPYRTAITLAELTADPSLRHHYLKSAEERLQEELPVIPLMFEEYRWIVNPHLQGVYLTTLGQIELKWAYWD